MLVFLLFILSLSGAEAAPLKLSQAHLLQNLVSVQNTSADSSDSVQNFVVQFPHLIREQDKKLLSRHFEILSYVPDNALLLRGQYSQARFVSSELKVYNYDASMKWSPDLPGRSIFTREFEETVLVKVFNSKDLKSLFNFLQTQQVEVLNHSEKILLVRASHFVLAQLAERVEVEHVGPVPQIESFVFEEAEGHHPNATETALTGGESGVSLTGFDQLSKIGIQGRDQIIAISDTGFSRGASEPHPEVGLQGGVHFYNELDWSDPIGHGTHVVGLAIGNGFYSSGFVRGMAPEAGAFMQSLYSWSEQKLIFPARLKEMFLASAQEGAYIHSNSWGSTENLGGYDLMAQQVDEFLYENPEHIILFSAGNEGRDLNRDGRIDEGSIASPATSKNVIAVGASEGFSTGGIQKPVSQWGAAPFSWPVEPIRSDRVSDNPNGLVMFSSRGPTQDGRLKPDLVAPGSNLLSLRSQHPHAGPLWGPYNDYYVWSGGTSMATPLVAGASALVRQWLIQKQNFLNPSGVLVKALLAITAQDLYPGQFGEVGVEQGQEILFNRPEVNQGFGRLQGADFMRFKGLLIDEKRGIAQGSVHEYEIEVGSASEMTITLMWYDAPALLGSQEQLVNDLDFVLVLPDGAEEVIQNRLNPFEFFHKKNLIQGTYRIRVKGTRIPMGVDGFQPYALAVKLNAP